MIEVDPAVDHGDPRTGATEPSFVRIAAADHDGVDPADPEWDGFGSGHDVVCGDRCNVRIVEQRRRCGRRTLELEPVDGMAVDMSDLRPPALRARPGLQRSDRTRPSASRSRSP